MTGRYDMLVILLRIKRLIVGGRYCFSRKALDELDADDLDPQDALEAVLNARSIAKSLRSRSQWRDSDRERLYVIKGRNYGGTLLYTKGKITREEGEEIYYFFISSKRSTSAE